MKNISSFLNKIPKNIIHEDYRQYRFFLSFTVLVLIGNIFFSLISLWLGNHIIIIHSYISIIINLAALFILFRGRISIALLILIFNIICFSSNCMLEFGLNTSFSFYYLALISFIFLTFWPWIYKILLSLAVVLSFPFTVFYAANNHDFVLSVEKVLTLNIINFIIPGAISSYLVFTYANNIKIAEAEFRDMHKAKERLYSIIAHDLRGPMGSVAGLSKILVEQLKKSEINSKTLKYANSIAKTTKDSTALLENLLAWTQNQQGDIAPNTKELNINSLIENCIVLNHSQIEQKALIVTNECSSKSICLADEKMIFTVIRNLISNAIKFSFEGGEIKISDKKIDETYTFMIEDTGLGISKEMINELFYPQINKVRPGTNNEQGSGFGLILCKELIEKNKGEIWVNSTLDNGTKVMFTLPSKL